MFSPPLTPRLSTPPSVSTNGGDLHVSTFHYWCLSRRPGGQEEKGEKGERKGLVSWWEEVGDGVLCWLYADK